MDVATGAKLRANVLIDVDARVPQRDLTAATEAGLAAAREASGAAIEAVGSLGSARAGDRQVRIDLTVRGSAGAALAAERAFGDAFIAHVEARGFAARRA